MTNATEISANEPCPCFSGKSYGDCCEPVISGTRTDATAVEIMRARYSAYATGAVNFIISSTLPEKRDECDERSIMQWSKNSEWTGFEIVSDQESDDEEDEYLVEFIAKFTEDRMKKTLHETAFFKKENGSWYYSDGVIHPPQTFIKPDEERISRNDPCRCGSGKKYKKCCMDK